MLLWEHLQEECGFNLHGNWVFALSATTIKSLLNLHPYKPAWFMEFVTQIPKQEWIFFSMTVQGVIAFFKYIFYQLLNFICNWSRIYYLFKNHITTAQHIVLSTILQIIFSVRIITVHLEHDPKVIKKNHTRIIRPIFTEIIN
jgi:hypothetical protein